MKYFRLTSVLAQELHGFFLQWQLTVLNMMQTSQLCVVHQNQNEIVLKSPNKFTVRLNSCSQVSRHIETNVVNV
jgi:hypothetical protein